MLGPPRGEGRRAWSMGWHIVKGPGHLPLCPGLCPWRGVPAAPSRSPSLVGAGGRASSAAGTQHSPQSPPAPPPCSFLPSEITPIVPDLCIQVLWPSRSPAWSVVATFHLNWLPKWRGTRTTQCTLPRTQPRRLSHSLEASVRPRAAGLHQRGIGSCLSMVPLARRVLHARGDGLRQTAFHFPEPHWPPPQLNSQCPRDQETPA